MRRTVLNILVHRGERSTRPSGKSPASVEGQRRALSPRADASASQPHSLIGWERGRRGLAAAECSIRGRSPIMLPESGSLAGEGRVGGEGLLLAVRWQF